MHQRGLSAQWLVGIIAIVVVAGTGFFMAEDYLYPTEEVNETLSTSTLPTTQLAADAYPLYGNAQWDSPKSEAVTIGAESYAGQSITSTTVQAGMDPAQVFTPFENYYDSKLKAAGWEVANELAAGGHTGGQSGYRKDGAIILTRFSIDYHNKPENAPSECPCDVTLSLFSSN
jgi:hypothetical protein